MYKTCPQCGNLFKARGSKPKFYSMECYLAWRMAQVSDPEKTKKKRRQKLLLQYVHGDITREKYQRKRDQLREERLI